MLKAIHKTDNEGTSKKFKYRKFGQLSYPLDLDTATFGGNEGEWGEFTFEECIRFSVQNRNSVPIAAFKAGIEAGVTAFKGNVRDAYVKYGLSKKEVDEITSKADKLPPKEQAQEVESKLNAKLKEKGKEPPDPTLFQSLAGSFVAMGQSFVKTREAAKKQTSQQLGSIYLNMPNAIQFNEQADWSGQELGMMGKGVQNMITGGGDTGNLLKGAAAGNVGNIVGAAIGGIPTLMSKMGVRGGMFGAALGAMAAGTPIQKGIESSIGIVQNPYLEMMFSGIGFREFQFDFTFRPRNKTEQEQVHTIIKMFRLNSRPTFTEGDFGKSFMDYPKEFKIEFLTKCPGLPIHKEPSIWQLNDSVPQLKTCVCSNVTTNYAPDNMWLAHQGGKPNAIQLSMSFKETELVMAEDIWNGGH